MMHTENFGVEGTQSGNGLAEESANLFGRAFLLRVRSCLNHLKSGSFSLKHLIKRSLSFPTTRAQSQEGGIQCDTSEPRGESRAALKGVQMSERIEECCLYRVFGVFTIAENSTGEPQNRIPMRHYKTSEGDRIAGPGTCQQVLFFLRCERRLHAC
jgi:hypothetical protein